MLVLGFSNSARPPLLAVIEVFRKETWLQINQPAQRSAWQNTSTNISSQPKFDSQIIDDAINCLSELLTEVESQCSQFEKDATAKGWVVNGYDVAGVCI